MCALRPRRGGVPVKTSSTVWDEEDHSSSSVRGNRMASLFMQLMMYLPMLVIATSYVG